MEHKEKCRISFYTEVSSGTYIRSLVRDIGRKLGVYATMTRLVRTKIDKYSIEESVLLEEIEEKLNPEERKYGYGQLRISAKEKINIEALKKLLSFYAKELTSTESATIITNIRHYEALKNALEALEKVEEGLMNHLSGDLLAIDIREVLYHLGSITGAVTNDELLGNIFSRFCIGK